jgi:tetratricopeptide (TPR) repeat protein
MCTRTNASCRRDRRRIGGVRTRSITPYSSCATPWPSSVRTASSTLRWDAHTFSTAKPGSTWGEGPLREADECARKVLALDPQCCAGLQLRAYINYSTGRIQEAVRDLKAAPEIEPNNPETLALLCNCYLISGYVSFARPLID